MSSTVPDADRRQDAQTAFVTLLTHPLLTARANPAEMRLLLPHRARLAEWAARLGYRLVVNAGVIRLHRDPAGSQRTAAPPPLDPPPRRDLVLQLIAAAACESTDETVTIQELSDEARALSVSPASRITPYDPDRRAERQAFLRALDRLAQLGVLVRRTSDEALLRQWETDGTGVGGGYEVDRDALLQLSDPYTVELALRPATGSAEDAETTRTATRTQRMLRTLVEDTALLYADLVRPDAEYARSQRSWLAAQAVEMTGGTVEIRAEGLLLRLPEDRPSSAAAVPAFPVATAPSWFALKALEAAIYRGQAPDDDGRIHLPASKIDRLVIDLYQQHHAALTEALAGSPDRLRSVVEDQLGGLGLIRPESDGSWLVLPTAGRFRDPVATWQPALTEPGDGEGPA
ncbi:DUF2398 family protein [Dactylosporangium darangshiense]|uniref:TIGR02678 family protein n=1 Tax=Dactylosporangium darangshiense TaxID=579108 RepID=A0ABP8DI51_9ACTN